MVNVFGESTVEERGMENLQVLRNVIAKSGKYSDFVKEIQALHKLGYPANRMAPEGSPPFYLRMRTSFFSWELIINIYMR